MRKKLDPELDTEIDEHRFVEDHPVYCPVPWCAAHKLRFARCGDEDGDYVGIHVARIKYVKTFEANERSRLRSVERLGLTHPMFATAVSRSHQDSIDLGLVPGRRGRRRP